MCVCVRVCEKNKVTAAAASNPQLAAIKWYHIILCVCVCVDRKNKVTAAEASNPQLAAIKLYRIIISTVAIYSIPFERKKNRR